MAALSALSEAGLSRIRNRRRSARKALQQYPSVLTTEMFSSILERLLSSLLALQHRCDPALEVQPRIENPVSLRN